MSAWLWISIPLCAFFFGATTGISLWMVLRRPGAGTRHARPSAAARPQPSDAGSPRRRNVQPVH
jgi:hypothetical protein